jgi:hypothetical protein
MDTSYRTTGAYLVWVTLQLLQMLVRRTFIIIIITGFRVLSQVLLLYCSFPAMLFLFYLFVLFLWDRDVDTHGLANFKFILHVWCWGMGRTEGTQNQSSRAGYFQHSNDWFYIMKGSVLTSRTIFFYRYAVPCWCMAGISYQWRTQELCSGGAGFNKFSWGQRAERTGIWER